MPQSRSARIASRLWGGLVAISILTVAFTLFSWWTDKAPPLRIVDAKQRATLVQRGGYLPIDYVIQRSRTCAGSLQRVFIDSQDVVQLIEPYPVNYSDGDQSPDAVRVTVSVPVPVGAALGPARYQAIFHFQCNPLQRLLGTGIEVRTPLIEFEVLPGDTPPILQRAPERSSPRFPSPMIHRASAVAMITPVEQRQRWTCREGEQHVRQHFRVMDGQRIFVRGYCRSRPDPPG